ncbi:hypothetical protein [Novosphingobium pentaromativorans]|uniref:Uncharacterized protein n=1 Tax=Novosphingobium pentaromativorans US6-1 TaxID=1088721 RepID=G6EI44_9SPHN|nr:hypothetical protein [Novosphingobium pentaromativorans]EHJ59032.1 hypothetical protein NSU_4015 [Novosphingobium pentaromativorans US6-1]
MRGFNEAAEAGEGSLALGASTGATGWGAAEASLVGAEAGSEAGELASVSEAAGAFAPDPQP